MARVVIAGGGWAGCAAALTAKHSGADEVVVLERADQLLGTGLVGGIMRNNGRFTAAEEMIALGGGRLFEVCDSVARHRDFEFPGHKHASLYDVPLIEPTVRRLMLEHGIELWMQARVTGIERSNGSIAAVTLEGGTAIEGDVFVDATGSFGGQSNCTDYGNGCVMCVLRCPTFGPRVSLTGLCGIPEVQGKKADGSIGAMSGSCEFSKDGVAPHIVRELEEKGVAIIPIPKTVTKEDNLTSKACQQYAMKEFSDNVVLLDTGRVKLMTTHMPLDQLRMIPGLENVRYDDPYSGAIGNSMRYMALAPRDDAMRVVGGVDNLFCGGEKAGLLVGHTEAMVTGSVAGHNAVRALAGKDPIVLPGTLACGDAISHVRERMQTEEGLRVKYTFSGSVYFTRMKELGLYSTDVAAIRARVDAAGLTGALSTKVI
jgi:threonine dehydrogenase-like Zn-dependent dehydrogenase